MKKLTRRNAFLILKRINEHTFVQHSSIGFFAVLNSSKPFIEIYLTTGGMFGKTYEEIISEIPKEYIDNSVIFNVNNKLNIRVMLKNTDFNK